MDATPDRDPLDYQFRRWREIHKRLHATPIHPGTELPRADQWRRIADYVKSQVAEPEIDGWVAEQIAVAENLARGIQDMRPRKRGPVHALLLEWVADRKQKAHAELKWNRAVEAVGGDPHWQRTGGKMDRSKPRN